MTFGRRFLCSSDAHSMLGNELSTLGAGHVAVRAAVAAASSSGLIWTDDRNVAWCTLRCPTVDGEGQYEPSIHARCAAATPASPARTLPLSTLHPARHRTLAKASSRADCSTGSSQETPGVGRYSSSTSSWRGIYRISAHLLYLDHFRALLQVLCI